MARTVMEEGAQRYIHGVANDWFDQVQKGGSPMDPNAQEKVTQLAE